jgi:hypothetical protein
VTTPDPVAMTRVRLAALRQAASGGGQVTAYDLARALQPLLAEALAIGAEAGRWQATHAAALRDQAAAEAAIRARFGPGSTEPGERFPRPTSLAAPRGDRAGDRL